MDEYFCSEACQAAWHRQANGEDVALPPDPQGATRSVLVRLTAYSQAYQWGRAILRGEETVEDFRRQVERAMREAVAELEGEEEERRGREGHGI